MFSDNLNTNIFVNISGKNYRQPVELDKNRITDFFQKKGFKVLNVEQIFRHAHGKLVKNNQIFFFKLASTKDISERNYNEMVWNQKINIALGQKINSNFCIPKIFSCGYFDNDKFFYISEFFDGPFLATKKPPNKLSLEDWIDKIVETNLYFLNIKDNLRFPRDDGELRGNVDFSQLFYNQDYKLLQDLKEFDLELILLEEKNLKLTYRPCINHGDFVPWHMIKFNEKFVLVDGEQGSCKLPMYFDIAYFYHRAYTGVEAPKLAKLYINKLCKNFSREEKDRFDIALRPLIANRIIGGFWHAKNEKQVDISYHLNLKKEFIKKELY